MSTISFQTEVKTATIVLKPHAMRLTRDSHDAEDLIQETIIRALTNEDKFQEGTNIRAWLFTIMRNIFINDYRKKSKRQARAKQSKRQGHAAAYVAKNWGKFWWA